MGKTSVKYNIFSEVGGGVKKKEMVEFSTS